jgi:hypothetical protein
LRAADAGDAVIAEVAEAAGRRGFAGAAIDLQFQAGAAEKELFRKLAEGLGVVEGVVERYFRALAERGEAVEIELGEQLLRAGFAEGAIVGARWR